MPMELLPINNNSGQSYGYILYATQISKDAKIASVYDVADRMTVRMCLPLRLCLEKFPQ